MVSPPRVADRRGTSGEGRFRDRLNGVDGPFRTNAASCVNHVGTAATACPKCRELYCAQCMPMTVNGDPWCELCVNDLAQDIKHPRIGVLVGAGGMILVTLLWFAKVMLVDGHPSGLRAPLPVFLGYLASAYAGHRLNRATTGDPPIIESRRR